MGSSENKAPPLPWHCSNILYRENTPYQNLQYLRGGYTTRRGCVTPCDLHYPFLHDYHRPSSVADLEPGIAIDLAGETYAREHEHMGCWTFEKEAREEHEVRQSPCRSHDPNNPCGLKGGGGVLAASAGPLGATEAPTLPSNTISLYTEQGTRSETNFLKCQ